VVIIVWLDGQTSDSFLFDLWSGDGRERTFWEDALSMLQEGRGEILDIEEKNKG